MRVVIHVYIEPQDRAEVVRDVREKGELFISEPLVKNFTHHNEVVVEEMSEESREHYAEERRRINDEEQNRARRTRGDVLDDHVMRDDSESKKLEERAPEEVRDIKERKVVRPEDNVRKADNNQNPFTLENTTKKDS